MQMSGSVNSAVLIPPCQDPPTRRHRLRTDKDCAQLANIIYSKIRCFLNQSLFKHKKHLQNRDGIERDNEEMA